MEKSIKLTGQGPIFYYDCVRLPIESGVSLTESELRRALEQAIRVKNSGVPVRNGSNVFTLDDAISNMERLLQPNPQSVEEWLANRMPW